MDRAAPVLLSIYDERIIEADEVIADARAVIAQSRELREVAARLAHATTYPVRYDAWST